MAVEARPELVGKRFLCVSGDEPLVLGDIGRWGWRAGVIRAVTHRDNDNSELTVYVEFDDLEWEKREWVKVYEDFQVFLLEQQLVWAKRSEGSALGGSHQGPKAKQIQWPALTFRTLVGRSTLGSTTAVEFLSDRRLDFLSDGAACQPYQDEVDSLSPVLRDNPQLQEEVRFWLKDQKVQEIFMQGPYSLNGYRVRVYRQDSATQWFTGIITHHDLFSRNMIVMNDQVLEPQNVDPSMVQMTFLDDVVHSLLKGENIGIQSRRRSRSSNNQNNSAHGHYTRAQANSPRPVMNSAVGAVKQGSVVAPNQPAQAQYSPSQGQTQGQRGCRSSRRKGSDSSAPDDDTKVKEDKLDGNERAGRDISRSKGNKQTAVNKRRKAEEEEKKLDLKRLKTERTVTSDFSESSDSEVSTKRTTTAESSSSSEHNSEEELKGRRSTSKPCHQGEDHKIQGCTIREEPSLIDRLSPWGEELKKAESQPARQQPPPLSSSTFSLSSAPSEVLGGCIIEANSTVKSPSQNQPKDLYTSSGGAASHAPSKCVLDITAVDANLASQENSEAVSALLASQNASEPSYIPEPSRHLVLNPSMTPPSPSPSPTPLRKNPSEGNPRSAPVSEDQQEAARSLGGKMDLVRPVTSVSETAAVAERERVQPQLHASVVPCIRNASLADEARKSHKPSPSPDIPKTKPLPSPDAVKSKMHSVPETGCKPKPLTSPEVSKHKVRHPDNPPPAPPTSRSVLLKPEPEATPPRSSFKPVPARGTTSAPEATKSPLIIDKNEHFTVYRDPALVRPEQESNHVSYLHLHPLHTTSSGHHHPSHLLPSSHAHHQVHHPHLLPGVLPGLPPGSLLGGHPRVDSSGLGHLGLAHHHPHQVQQHQAFLQQHQQPPGSLLAQTHSHSSASYNQLGLYPIIWQYPNGTHSYPPGLNMPGSKWVHPENAVNSEANVRRNTASPWLHHQHPPVSSSDSLGLLSHVPVRPASADPHRSEPHRTIKINPHASPPLPLSKTTGELHKEELEKKGFVDPIRTITLAHLKQERDRSRTPTGKDGHLHRLYLEAHKQQRMAQQEAGERASKYKEENRRILQESIEVAPFTAKIRSGETDREPPYSRVPPLPPQPPPHPSPKGNEADRPGAERYGFKQHATAQHHSLPQSNYFTTLSNSVVNEPPRLYPSKELNSYFEKVTREQGSAAGPGGGAAFGSKSLSKPPPLIKHHPDGEGLVGKMSEQLSQQVGLSSMQHHPLHTIVSPASERRSPAMSPSSSQLQNQLRCMPALHRAPVFHPPTQQTLDRKEVGYGRLSPPTLTPIQPVSSASKVSEQQKPPTLLPELREVGALCKVSAETTAAATTTTAGAWHAGDSRVHDQPGWHSERSRGGKPGAATASVIVRPSTCIKYDGSPGPRTAPPAKEPASGRLFPAGRTQTDCLKPAEERERGRESGGRVILPNTNLDESGCMQQYRRTLMRASPAAVPAGAALPAAPDPACNMRSDVPTATPAAASRGMPCRGGEAAYCASDASIASGPRVGPFHTGPGAQLQEGCSSRTSSPSLHAQPGPSPGSSQSYSGSFIHLKKHKAVLAAQQSRGPGSGGVSGPESLSEPAGGKAPHSSPPPPSSSQDPSTNPAVCKASPNPGPSPLPNGQPVQMSQNPNQSQSQPNYHKLKKAWLTRHSEEDSHRSTVAVIKTEKLEKPPASVSPAVSEMEMIKPCTVALIASTSGDVEMKMEEVKGQEDKTTPEDRKTRRGNKRTYDHDSATESGEDSDASESSKQEQRAKRQPKPTYKKKQNDLQKRKGEGEKDEDDMKPNGIFRSAREKTKLKLASSNGIPRSVLRDWRKVKKLKQTGESFLQDDSCSEIGPNLQKCRECRVVRSKKGEEPAHSPVFCRFYYFRRLSYSKNGVIRVDGFSTPDQFDDEALSLWAPDVDQENQLDPDSSKYILSYIGDKFCQMVTTENTAATWIKKDAQVAWKRAVRGVREMCDACEATLFNIHWVCQKCGFVVCLDCYKAKERKNPKDKEQYVWLKCVKGQPHDHKHLMPTQIIPGTVLTELVSAMHMFRERYNIKAHCACTAKPNTLLNKLPTTNGVSQVLQNVLNHCNKISLCNVKTEPGQLIPSQGKPETNGGSSPTSDTSSDPKLTPPESQSPLHFLADLAEQKSREEKKENKKSPVGKTVKEEDHHDVSALESLHCKASSLVSNSSEQGSTLRDLLTTTAGKLRMGSTDAGIAFAPVYSTATQTGKSGRSMPNILDDIIASVVENKIPASRGAKLSLKLEATATTTAEEREVRPEKTERKRQSGPGGVPDEPLPAKPQVEKTPPPLADAPHHWLYQHRLLWLKDHRHPGNRKLFRECWRQGQPVLVSGVHKRLNAALWKAESFNQEFADHQGDLVNCKDGIISNSGIKEFWDGFEDLTKRPKSKDGETLVYRLKDWPSGEEFMALMPSRYDDLMRNLPLPEYSDPEGNLNLASHLPSFFVRPDLGPRLCCAYGVAASQEQDFGTANLHMEVSDIVSVLVYVGVAKGNGVLSKTGVLKRLEEEDLDDSVKRRLKDSSETPGALWHIYVSKDVEKIKEFLHKVAKEQGVEVPAEHDPIRELSWYLSRKLRQRLWEDHGVQGWTVVQFLGDSVLIPAGALHQVQNLHSCVQVINDFVSPEHVFHSFNLTQELRSSKEEFNYEDKLQVKNILYHCVKDAVTSLRRFSQKEQEEEEEEKNS
ncbi:probable JmjC domain-containing histone demethylation protein 2C isoform X3 [Esox lucius]|uniref:probable JmjC domain-containing histone demethylation protein 2C isoform X3 n=1 Tax=Esox lucius TaxID=8010 RepID=UPI001476CAE8|nr:probable JmjC domain-containing histone demethylation protein 2C isoform X3 [Esox lucius]